MNLAVIGYGSVGKAFVNLLNQKSDYLTKENIDINVKYIVCSSGGIYSHKGLDLELLYTDYADSKSLALHNDWDKNIIVDTVVADDDIDLAVVMTPTNKESGEPGLEYIRRLLAAEKNVVTSDKGPVLLAYNELQSIAIEKGVQFCIGCTTGGALPTINGGMIDLAGAKITSIEGVLNGTTNYILDCMMYNDYSYMEALCEAQRLGIAETDSSLDVEGYDTAIKLLILSNLLMNVECRIGDVEIEGITKITKDDIKAALEKNEKYRLIGRAIKTSNETIKIKIAPERVGADSVFYMVGGKNKAVRYVSDTLGDLFIMGGASGTTPAAASILRDIVNISRGYRFSR